MGSSMIIGQYVPGNSFVHQIDPRSKMLIIFFYVIFVFFANNVWSYSLLTLFIIITIIITRIPIKFIIKGLTPIWFVISCGFCLLLLMTSLLTLTKTPIEIPNATESLLGPLKKMKFPVHELALMMSISLRFIPTLMQETDKISKAQASRGVDFRTGKIKDRIKGIIPLLVPLFVNAFK